jgi:hypothetical protein
MAKKKAASAAPATTSDDVGTIRITCDPDMRLERHPVGDLQDFQGSLKVLPEKNVAELTTSLVDLGYSFPTAIWYGTSKILDGHQRNFVLAGLIRDGWSLVEYDGSPASGVPVVQVVAENEDEARRKVLAAVSQYGKVSPEGLQRFLADGKMKWDDVSAWVDLPDFDPKAFEKAFTTGPGTATPPGSGFQDPEANMATQYCCPKCGYEWSGKPRTG